MSGAINLADPAFEPTDAQLEDLSRRAFAHVRAAHEASRVALRERVREAREQALASVRKAPK